MLHALTVSCPLECDRDPLPSATLEKLKAGPRIRTVGFTSNPEEYFAAADIFCLPSYREGFGTVVIEAGAMGVPTVATRITGLVDAVQDGRTGLLVRAKDAVELETALWELIASPELCKAMGRAARERVLKDFDAAIINQSVVSEYLRIAVNV